MSQKKKSSGKGIPAIGAFISFGEVSSSLITRATSTVAYSDDSATRMIDKGCDIQPVYTGSDADLMVISKKLLKKDSTTKLKSFNELVELVNRTEKQQSIAEFIPYFVYVYLRVSLDNDRKLRELLNIALLGLIVNTDKLEERRKTLGPYMKTLIGHLWINAADSCPEVSRASSKAFNAAIPSEKKNQRLIALSPFILKYISKNLASQVSRRHHSLLPTASTCTERFHY